MVSEAWRCLLGPLYRRRIRIGQSPMNGGRVKDGGFRKVYNIREQREQEERYVNKGDNGSLRLKEMGREEWRWSPEKKDSGQGRFIENEGIQYTLYLYAE